MKEKTYENDEILEVDYGLLVHKLCGIPHNLCYVELLVMWNFIKRSP